MAAQVAVTIIDEFPGRLRQVAFRLELWSETVTARELIDSVLSIVLSKAMTLAADTKITDPLIVRQIGEAER